MNQQECQLSDERIRLEREIEQMRERAFLESDPGRYLEQVMAYASRQMDAMNVRASQQRRQGEWK